MRGKKERMLKEPIADQVFDRVSFKSRHFSAWSLKDVKEREGKKKRHFFSQEERERRK